MRVSGRCKGLAGGKEEWERTGKKKGKGGVLRGFDVFCSDECMQLTSNMFIFRPCVLCKTCKRCKCVGLSVTSQRVCECRARRCLCSPTGRGVASLPWSYSSKAHRNSKPHLDSRYPCPDRPKRYLSPSKSIPSPVCYLSSTPQLRCVDLSNVVQTGRNVQIHSRGLRFAGFRGEKKEGEVVVVRRVKGRFDIVKVSLRRFAHTR